MTDTCNLRSLYYIVSSSLIITCASLTGCFSNSSPEPQEEEAKELAPPKNNDIDQPQDVLFQTAKQSFHNGLYSISKDQFEALKNNFPSGPYFEFAEIKAADSVFEMKDYPSAMQLYEEFAKSRPGQPASAYALLKAAESARLASKGVGRDVGQLEKSRELYERLIEQYPDSVYLRAALEARKHIIEELGEYENIVAAFYLKQGKMQAYEARKKEFEQKWRPLIAESDQHIERSTQTAQTYSDTEIVQVNSAPQIISANREVTKIPEATHTQPHAIHRDVPPPAQTRYQIERVSCKENVIFLHLNQTFSDAEFLQEHEVVEAEDGAITISLPETSAAEAQIECTNDYEISITASGTVSLGGREKATLFTLSNPARIIIALD